MGVHTVRLLGELRFSTTAEDTVPVFVKLNRNRFDSPWNERSVGDGSCQFKRGSSIHFRDDLATDWTVGIAWVNLSTWWQIAVAAIDEFDEPMCCIHINEINDVLGFTGQGCWVSIPKHTVGFVGRDIVVVQSSCRQSRSVIDVAPISERSIAIVDG